MKGYRIGIIGCIADGVDLFDGQTVSTRVWRDELNKLSQGKPIYEVDTYNYLKNPIKLLYNYIQCIKNCTHIVVMLSRNGLKLFLPLLYLSTKIHGTKVYHRVIGGSIENEVLKHQRYRKYLNSFEVNWVQSNRIVEGLKKKYGVMNAEYLENFRNVAPIDEKDIRLKFTQPYNFCTFSRVSKSKGIALAITSIGELNRESKEIKAVLHIYGPIEESFKEEFASLLEKYSNCVEYKGCVPSEQAVQVLKDYYMHLFPTTWSGEGFPGTIIDCFNAGLPTIASNWAYNEDIISDGENGLIYDYKVESLLKDKIQYAIDNHEAMLQMRKKCCECAKKYTSTVVMKKVKEKML